MNLDTKEIRKTILKMIHSAGSGHIGGSFSIVEVVSYLYSNFNLSEKNGDKIILSKGHAVPCIYSVLFQLGLIDESEIYTFRKIDSRLQGHPDKKRLDLLHGTTGSLGQGLSLAIGHALAFKMKNLQNSSFCIVGDGELQEGQIWESFMLAPKFNLDNLCCFIDRNGSQNDGYVDEILSLDPLDKKIRSFGWDVCEIDGHSIEEIHNEMDKFRKRDNCMPKCVILNTKKGMGVSFMMNPSWHAKAPTDSELESALREIDNESDA